ncbi:MAG: hypothetical protein QM703_15870 [Gemmatales bacterium]
MFLLVSMAITTSGFTADLSKAPELVFEGKLERQVLVGKVDADTPAKVKVLLKIQNNRFQVINDDVTRLLFMDEQFAGRHIRLTAVVVAGTTSTLKVKKVQTVVDGKVFDVDYWCERCQLAATEPGKCRCCGGDTVLRELPAK